MPLYKSTGLKLMGQRPGSLWGNAWKFPSVGFGKFGPTPDVYMNFAGGYGTVGNVNSPIASLLTCARVGYRYVDDINGNWTPVGPNLPAISTKGLLVEEARTNSLKNNSMQGAVVGTPGTLPVGWTYPGLPSGITSKVVAVGTVNGIDYIDINYSGTNAGSLSAITLRLGSVTDIPASSGQTWTHSVFLQIIQTDPIVTAIASVLTGTNGATQTEAGSSVQISPATLTRQTSTLALANASTTNVELRVNTVGIPNNATINFTMRVGWPQLEQGAVVTSPIRTGNFIRNSVAQGGAAGAIGSGGAYPSNWNGFGPTGTSTTVVAFGTVNGIDYIDLHIVGTPTGANFNGLFELNSTIPALNGQTWTASCYIALIAGSMANVVNMNLNIGEYNGGALVAGHPGPNLISLVNNTFQRYTNTITFSQPTTNFTNILLNTALTVSQPIDFTIRLGWPQLEIAPSASPHMRTGASPTGVNRPIEVVSLTTPPVYGNAYSMYAAGASNNPNSYATQTAMIAVSDGTFNNTADVGNKNGGTSSEQVHVRAANVAIWVGNSVFSPNNPGISSKYALAVANGDMAATCNGNAPFANAAAGAPSGGTLTKTTFGVMGDNSRACNGYITEAAIWANQRLTNAQLQAGTT